MVKMKVKNALFLLALSIPLFGFTTETLSDFTIYYQSSDESIYGITDLTGKPSLVAANVPNIVEFSNSGRYIAYYDAEGVWISPTEIWSPKKVISTLPHEAFAPIWTPDDTRLILRLAFWPKNTDPATQPLAYNLLTESTEPWIWGVCDQLAQDKVSKDFALICDAYKDTPKQKEQVDAIALKWGGEFSQYDPNQYETLLSGIIDNFPRPFNWGMINGRENLVYITENPAYSIDNEAESFWKIFSQWSDGEKFEIHGPQEPEIESWFEVSPDRTMLASTVACRNPLGSCLQITNLKTGEIIWSYKNTVRADQIDDIAWYPDNRKVALLGANHFDFGWKENIQVFDLETGSSVKFDIESTTGVITVF